MCYDFDKIRHKRVYLYNSLFYLLLQYFFKKVSNLKKKLNFFTTYNILLSAGVVTNREICVFPSR